ELSSKRKLAVIGGRAFVKSSDYQQLMERVRTGDLQSIASEELFANILFSESQRVGEMAERVDRAVRRLHSASSNGSGTNHSSAAAKAPVEPAAAKESPNQDLEIEVQRLRNELESRSRFAESLQHFLERISCEEPLKTYNSIVSNSKELLRSERASLMVLNETANALVLKAASGLGLMSRLSIRSASAKEYRAKLSTRARQHWSLIFALQDASLRRLSGYTRRTHLSVIRS